MINKDNQEKYINKEKYKINNIYKLILLEK